MVIDPSDVAFPLALPLASRTGLPGGAEFEETRFHAELPDELSSARKYETELLSASIHAVSSLEASAAFRARGGCEPVEEGDIPDSVIETIDGHGSWSACAASENRLRLSKCFSTLRGLTKRIWR